jgi:nicotinamide-nucleotide amidase
MWELRGGEFSKVPDAEIIAVGSELLTHERVDTNSLFITEQLNALGIEVIRKLVVGDDRRRLTAAIRDALSNVEIVVLSGGLGPTEDDLTRDAVADALGRKLVFSQETCDQIEERFRRFQRKMAEINKRQAYLVEGADALENPRGTAPGQWIETSVQTKGKPGGRIVMLLPGPPGELKPMFTDQCVPRLIRHLPPQVIRVRQFRVAGMGESDLDQLIAPVYTKYTNPATTILAGAGDIHVNLRARGETEEEVERLLNEVAPPIEELLGDRVYSRNGDSIETVVGNLLRGSRATLSAAESCTGGIFGQRLTSVPGSSDYFLGGVIAYSDSMKVALLGVDPVLIETHTAVSEEVARAMAAGARVKTGSTYAISITGEAGPRSATGAAPGTVFLGFANEAGTDARKLHLPGDRNRIRNLAAQSALDFVRRKLMAADARR